MSCTSNTCTCAMQDTVNNVLVNAGFDTSLSPGWFVNDNPSAKKWSGPGVDADGCPGSGSLLVSGGQGDVTQCVPAVAGAFYFAGLKFKQTSGRAFVCSVVFSDTSDCSDFPDSTFNLDLEDDVTISSNWSSVSTSGPAPPWAVAVQISCGSGGTANLNQFYLRTSPGGF